MGEGKGAYETRSRYWKNLAFVSFLESAYTHTPQTQTQTDTDTQTHTHTQARLIAQSLIRSLNLSLSRSIFVTTPCSHILKNSMTAHTLDVRARPCCLQTAFIRLDFPTFDRPENLLCVVVSAPITMFHVCVWVRVCVVSCMAAEYFGCGGSANSSDIDVPTSRSVALSCCLL